MNTIKRNGVGSGGGVQEIPLGSRRIVQSLKEIVSCSEADCNMDPHEAVNRLLCQDPFHEVEQTRKEGKDIFDSRPRGADSSSNRGSKNISDGFHGRGGLTPKNSYGESSPLHEKSSFKKDNESARVHYRQHILCQQNMKAKDLLASVSVLLPKMKWHYWA